MYINSLFDCLHNLRISVKSKNMFFFLELQIESIVFRDKVTVEYSINSLDYITTLCKSKR